MQAPSGWSGGTLTVGRVIYAWCHYRIWPFWDGRLAFFATWFVYAVAWRPTMASGAMWHLQRQFMESWWFAILSDTSPPHRVWLRLGNLTVSIRACISGSPFWMKNSGFKGKRESVGEPSKDECLKIHGYRTFMFLQHNSIPPQTNKYPTLSKDFSLKVHFVTLKFKPVVSYFNWRPQT